MAPLLRLNFYSTCDQSTFWTLDQLQCGKRKLNRTSVKFSKTVTIYQVPNRKQFTKEETRSTYLSSKEIKKIRAEIINAVREIAVNKKSIQEVEEEMDISLRGLESCLPHVAKERKQRMVLATETVLQQQELGVNDVDWIAEMYSKFSSQAAIQAHLRGLQDQQDSPYLPPKVKVMLRN